MTREIVADYRDLFSLDNLYNAYLACRRHKRNTVNAMNFEISLLENLCSLRDELVERTYHPSSSICFVQKRPKLREIFAADFRDRVVHHLLVGYLEPLFERMFCYDSYACRKGKGLHFGIGRLGSFLNRVTSNGTRHAWYLKEDIKGFFMNIDKSVLFELITRRVKREDVRWLAGKIIFHDCTLDYRFKGKRWLLDIIPPHKTLFKTPEGKGLPIGNLSSQFFANVYLKELDQYVKRTLKCRFYCRYCDDFLLLSQEREQLFQWHEAIKAFVMERLELEVKPHLSRPVSSGIDFLGYVVRRRHVLVRRRVVNHFRERLYKAGRRMGMKERGEISCWRFYRPAIEEFRSVAASYWGHFAWADSFHLKRSLYGNHPVLLACFQLDNRLGLVPRWDALKRRTSVMRQWKECRHRFNFSEDTLS